MSGKNRRQLNRYENMLKDKENIKFRHRQSSVIGFSYYSSQESFEKYCGRNCESCFYREKVLQGHYEKCENCNEYIYSYWRVPRLSAGTKRFFRRQYNKKLRKYDAELSNGSCYKRVFPYWNIIL